MPPKKVATLSSIKKRKRPVDAKATNLNDRIDDAERKSARPFKRGCTKVSVLLDGKGIQNAICQQIRRKDTHYVVGCIAWMSNKKILKELAAKKGVCIICTRDKLTRANSNQVAYSKLKEAYRRREPSASSEEARAGISTMHHKFLIGMDMHGKALWCTNGSFNMTTHALSNLENCTIFEDRASRACTMTSFDAYFKYLSTKLRIKV